MITPNGKTAYAGGKGGKYPAVTPINTATNATGAPIPINLCCSGSLIDLAISRGGQSVYVLDVVTDAKPYPPGCVIVIDTATNQIAQEYLADLLPGTFAFTP